MVDKKIKKCVRDGTYMTLIFVTLICTVVFGGIGLATGKGHKEGDKSICKLIGTNSFNATLCNNDDVYIKIASNPDKMAVHWKKDDLLAIVNVMEYLSTEFMSETFKFYFLPDLVFLKNGTSDIKATLFDVYIDVSDLLKLFDTVMFNGQ